MAIADSPRIEGATVRARPLSSARVRVFLPVVGIYALAVLVYVVLGRRQLVPLFAPDEFRYEHFARSVAAGDGFTWWGQHQAFGAKLFVYLLSPAWLISHGIGAYKLALLLSAAYLCTVAFPVWYLVRTRAGETPALVASVLALAGTWMVSAGGLLTENVALPVATIALACLATTLTTGSRRHAIATVVVSMVAVGCRVELFALLPLVFLITLGYVALGGRAWRDRAREQRALLAMAGGLCLLALLAAVVTDARLLSDYRDLGDPRLSFPIVGLTGKHAAQVVATMGILPFLLVAAASLSRDNWRSREIAPLLLICWIAGLVFCAIAATAVHWYKSRWAIPRYAEYSLPLFIATSVVLVVRRAVQPLQLGLVTVVSAGLLLLTPTVQNWSEERALQATWRMVHPLVGGSAGLALAISTLVLGGFATALVSGRVKAVRGAAIGLAVVTAMFLFGQSAIAWHWQRLNGEAALSNLPSNLNWVDDASREPVSRLVVSAWPQSADFTDFYNERIDAGYAGPRGFGGARPNGPVCAWGLSESGVMRIKQGCRMPRRVLLDDPWSRVTFYNQHLIAREPKIGSIVALPPKPHVLSVVQLPCTAPVNLVYARGRGKVQPPERRCGLGFSVSLFTNRPSTFELKIRGGENATDVIVGQGRLSLPAHKVTSADLPVPRGHSSLAVQTGDWTDIATSPSVVSMKLKWPDGTTTSLL